MPARALHGVEGLTCSAASRSSSSPGSRRCAAGRAAGLGVLVFSGYTLAELGVARPGGRRCWRSSTRWSTGASRRAAREPSDGRRFIGSRNQRLVHRTPRYADPALWRGPGAGRAAGRTRGEIGVHGDPDLARRLTRASILLGRGVQARP
jgi:anaerobic ribonucleoside-triphosphate reductase activating protein